MTTNEALCALLAQSKVKIVAEWPIDTGHLPAAATDAPPWAAALTTPADGLLVWNPTGATLGFYVYAGEPSDSPGYARIIVPPYAYQALPYQVGGWRLALSQTVPPSAGAAGSTVALVYALQGLVHPAGGSLRQQQVVFPTAQPVAIQGTVSVAIDTSGGPVDVAISGTPTVNIAAGQSVAITGTVTVSISGTPTVAIAANQSIAISGTVTVNVNGTPNINISSQSITLNQAHYSGRTEILAAASGITNGNYAAYYTYPFLGLGTWYCALQQSNGGTTGVQPVSSYFGNTVRLGAVQPGTPTNITVNNGAGNAIVGLAEGTQNGCGIAVTPGSSTIDYEFEIGENVGGGA